MNTLPIKWDEVENMLSVTKGEPFPHVTYAQFVTELCKDDIRYVPELGKWLEWNGLVWEQTTDDFPASQALDTTVRTLMQWGADNAGITMQVSGYIKNLLNVGIRGGIVACMKNTRKLRASVHKLDANPDLITCTNGTINLRTGEFYTARPDDLITHHVRVEYHADADQTLWVDFLNQCHPSNPDRVDYLKVLLGYAITGHTSEEISAFFYGSGANGKGVCTGTLSYLFADMCCTMPTDFWTKQYGGRNGAVVGKLDGPRLCLSDEMSGQKLDEEFYKTVIGRGELSCNPKYGHPYDFTPKSFILWSGNDRPRIANTDDSVWRRLKLIPWEESFLGERSNPKLKAEMLSQANLQGVLAWLVEGAQEWYSRGGLPASESVDDATAEYRKESNPNYDWAHLLFEEAEGSFLSSREIKEIGKKGLHRPSGSDKYWPKSVADSFPNAQLSKSHGERGVKGVCVKGE